MSLALPFLSFLRLLLERWVLGMIFFGDLIALIAGMALPSLQLPQPIYWAVGAAGVVWASFEVYREGLAATPAGNAVAAPAFPGPAALVDAHDDRSGSPHLVVSFLEGHEYTFSLDREQYEDRLQRESVRGPDIRPDAFVVLHTRVTNAGAVAADLLSVKADFPWEPDRLFFDTVQLTFSDSGEEAAFPFKLERGWTKPFALRVKLMSTGNNAQFAARLGASSENQKTTCSVRVETRGGSGGIATFDCSWSISIRPLAELYMQLWQEEGKADLLKLAQHLRSSP